MITPSECSREKKIGCVIMMAFSFSCAATPDLKDNTISHQSPRADIPANHEGVMRIRLYGSVEVAPKLEPTATFRLKSSFETKRSELTSDGLIELKALVEDLKRTKIERIEVIGHTDNRPLLPSATGRFFDNYALSLDRAKSAAKVFSESMGLSPTRIWVSGKGPDEPIANNITRGGLARNRRIEIRIFANVAAEMATPSIGVSIPHQGVPRLSYHVDLSGSTIPVRNLRVIVGLPQGMRLIGGSARLNGFPLTTYLSEDETVVFNLGDMGAHFRNLLDFDATQAAEAASEIYTMKLLFDAGEAVIHSNDKSELGRLAKRLSGKKFDYLEIIGHPDREKIVIMETGAISNNSVLSRERANAVADYLVQYAGIPKYKIRTSGEGHIPDNVISEYPNRPKDIIDAEGNATDSALYRPVEIIVHKEIPEYKDCSNGLFYAHATALFSTDSEFDQKTPTVKNQLPCALKLALAGILTFNAHKNSLNRPLDKISKLIRVDASSDRKEVTTRDFLSQTLPRVDRMDNTAATPSAWNPNWLLGQIPGIDWLFPSAQYYPGLPVLRVVIKHLPSQFVALTYDGKPVDSMTFDRTEMNADATVAVSVWHNLPLRVGDNRFIASITDGASGKPVSLLSRIVHYSNSPTP